MKDDCMMNLNFTHSDLATKATQSTAGIVRGISLQTVIERSGTIDILKLDCEGAEWGLLERKEPWHGCECLQWNIICGVNRAVKRRYLSNVERD